MYLQRKKCVSFWYFVDTKNKIYPQNTQSTNFLHSSWCRCILNSHNCTYIKQKTFDVKGSFFKHEVDYIYRILYFASNNYWLQFECMNTLKLLNFPSTNFWNFKFFKILEEGFTNFEKYKNLENIAHFFFFSTFMISDYGS